jgi:streptomycin 3"-adenylyltransferase
LAAHITITLSRGICLMGPPITAVFPPVPPEDYVKSIVADFAWAGEFMAANPVYFLLNACRVYAYFLEAKILSKDEGGEWAARHLPEAFQGIVAQALSSYRGQPGEGPIDAQALQAFASYIGERLHVLQAATSTEIGP